MTPHAMLRGFSLIELLSTLAIASILTLVAVPNFQNLIRSHKSSASINELLTHLQFARTYALSHSKFVSICAIDGEGCGNDWSKGIYVFLDDNIDGEINSPNDIIRQMRRENDGSTITLNAAANANFISYTPQGTSTRKNSRGNIVYCNKSGDTQYSKVIVYFVTGRAYLGLDRNKNGIPENGSKNDIEC